ncbi:MAG: pyridoxal phosphate-dependent aminotransferase [Bacteroidetes bacterium]|nr:MAG: pyridoxal phosphate-dependent aminotransferase [Bacteroidota bacterium]
MPQLSERGKIMPASPIRKLVPYAEDAKKRGIKVYHLNIGQPDIKTPEVAFEALKNFNVKTAEYSHSAGNESYRKGLAEYYKSVDIDLSYEDIMVTTGGSEAIIFAFMATMNPGDEVIIPEPFYTNYNGFAVEAGVKIVPVTSYIEDGFALPPISDFEKLITSETKAVLVCNPNNPTGYLYSKEELMQVRELVLKHDLYLFADEVYREFCYDGNEHYSVMQMKGLEKNAVLFDSVSKRYSECGVRIGALISRNKDLMASALKYGQARLSPPLFGQIAAEASLKVGSEYFDEVYNEYIERRNYVINALNKIDGVVAPMPKGSFYAVISLPIEDAEDFCVWLLKDFDYNGETVMLAPAQGFYSTPDAGKTQVRLAYVLKVEDLKHSVKILEEALKVYKK